MHIKVSEQGSEETGVDLILDVNGCISLEYLQRYFSGATGLKYLDADSGRWIYVPFGNNQFIIVDEDFNPNILYIIHRQTEPTSTQSTTINFERDCETPPIRRTRTAIQYLQLVAVAIFASQTAILLSVLAADYRSFFEGPHLALKNSVLLMPWFLLAIYSIKQIRDAFMDFLKAFSIRK